ncbi:FAD-binding protein [Neptuniibacter sp.]|uniref:FAD-binding protein n=1 Tax=Neptuniibacter sp. TaxID=1962643 RepID=UPI0026249DED|nr:FAD-binding protein [Neptuniibacter sp.]MCP4595988.1 FAD-dependent oxidoreductase [Neptuniibacter sp.]
MATKPEKWDLETDVLVVGSGGSGLTAAMVAHDMGSRVTLIEKTDKIGGATALSGGFPWIPNNHLEKELGIPDSREEALTYMTFITQRRVDDELVEVLIDKGPEMLKYIEDKVGLRFSVSSMPDYHAEKIGGKVKGRSLGPPAFDTNLLGEKWKDKIRPAPITMIPISWAEFEASDAMANPKNLDFKKMAENMTKGIVGMGMATVGYLLKGCLDRDIELLLKSRARELVLEDGRVIGLKAEKDGQGFCIRASQGVILASGGFEWNEELKNAFIPGPDLQALSHPANEGDGHRMAMAVGAELGNMSEFWGQPAAIRPGEEYEGRQLVRITMGERSLPHAIMVNRNGRRFVDEAHNYSDIAKTFCAVDPVAHDHCNFPAWVIFDQQFRERYGVLTVFPDAPDPDWLIKAETLEDLAGKAKIDAKGLKATVERFNGFAREGVDPDFHRGASAYDKWGGDANHKPNPSLGTIENPPFYAMSIVLGTLGTKGGPRTDVNGQVRHIMGGIIQGLYAAGNVMASTSGPGYGGAGNTIGAGMTWGYIAAKHAALRIKK